MKKKYGLKKVALSGKTDYAGELNPQQLKAVTASDGPALVIAGAGSGKTRVVTYRVAFLLEKGVSPDEILLLTFTKKAAAEMLQRVEDLVTVDAARIWGGTFHHVGNRILRKHAELLGFQSNYSILDRDDSRVLIDSVVRESGIDTKARRFPKGRVLLEIIGYARNTDTTIAEAVEVKVPHFEQLLSEIEMIAVRYARKKKKLNYMDFDDLLIYFAELLSGHPEVAGKYSRQFKYILVDEYQDTNRIQARIVDLLGGGHRNIMVVGDDSQSIYSFRGALFRNIRDFPKIYQGCRVYTVETNYRSTPEILHLANRILAGREDGFQKILRPVKKSGPRPALIRTENVYEQAEFIAQRILELAEEGVNPGEIAILYRSHFHSMEIQMELTRREIPFTVRSGLRFFQQAHIKDVLSYLKIIDNPHDEIAWKRTLVLIPRIGARTADKIWDILKSSSSPLDLISGKKIPSAISAGARPGWDRFSGTLRELKMSSGESPAQLIGMVMESEYDDYLQSKYSNYERRLEDLRQMANYAARYDDLKKFLDELAMIGGLNTNDVYSVPQDEMVVLSTIHQSKGLEWDVVFIIWLAEGRFPPASSYGDDGNMEEERRLFYVAGTRSREELYMIHPMISRRRSGEEVIMQPSRFIQDLPPDCYEEWELYNI
ncbi:MAG: ATP-dependent helicase [Candidatus Auribacterota bacterium]|nr:ATP-dependent helicase [Candidatus Auribacterota bacterium]